MSNTDMHSFLAVIALAAFSAIAVAQNAPTPNAGVQTNWQTIDQLCGQIELPTPKQKRIVVDGKYSKSVSLLMANTKYASTQRFWKVQR
ncbi:MAG: hypothetical protein WA637_08115 [Terriglobales bacterium]